MLVIGKSDAFEQDYMAKFEKLASKYGVFVKYERDRAARDIGLHLTKKMKSGMKQVTNSLVWFQMKGVMKGTLSKEKFDEKKSVTIAVKVEHLRHWFLDKEPTHLVVYVESADQFLVMNLQEYIARTWGRRVLELEQETAEVTVPAASSLDKQAFDILLRYAEVAQWMKAVVASHADMVLVNRDHDQIYKIGTAAERKMQIGAFYKKWLSKGRDEMLWGERAADFDGDVDDGWEFFHEHWQYMGIDLESSYAYLEFHALDEYEPETFTNQWGESELVEDGETIEFANGDQVFGINCANEYIEFIFGARLNEYGEKLLGYIRQLLKMGLMELRDDSKGHSFLDVAPWHNRLV